MISKYIKYVRGNVYNNQNKTKKNVKKREYRGLRSLCSRIKQSEVITMKIIYNSGDGKRKVEMSEGGLGLGRRQQENVN